MPIFRALASLVWEEIEVTEAFWTSSILEQIPYAKFLNSSLASLGMYNDNLAQ